MRTNQKWNDGVRENFISVNFTPRIYHDLSQITFPNFTDYEIKSIFIWGNTGYGKTLTAASLMIEEQRRIYLNNGPKNDYEFCKFISVPELFEDLKRSFGDSAKTNRIIQAFQNIHLLVLDDMGVTKPTDWVLQMLYLIINHRYEFCKKTIITSNIGLKELSVLLGDDRITSRIERSYQLINKLDWKTKK
jgi:DNA replication protein DnaC